MKKLLIISMVFASFAYARNNEGPFVHNEPSTSSSASSDMCCGGDERSTSSFMSSDVLSVSDDQALTYGDPSDVPLISDEQGASGDFSTDAQNCNWPSVNHDHNNTRSNPCETILSPSTVGGLTLLQNFILPTAAVAAAPAVVNGVVYW